jgi:nitrite transporter NirC
MSNSKLERNSKADRFYESVSKILLNSIMSGIYISIVVLGVYTMGNTLNENIRNLVIGNYFGVGLSLVIMLESKLFTGEILNLTRIYKDIYKTTPIKKIISYLILVWIGNLIGCIMFSSLYYFSYRDIFTQSHIMYDISVNKVSLPIAVIVVRGILANLVVGTAILIAGRFKNNYSAKLISTWWIMTIFFVLSLEHCVANMSTLTVFYLISSSASSLYGIMYNLFFSTLGNILAFVFFLIYYKSKGFSTEA